jgi:hypothetical protein
VRHQVFRLDGGLLLDFGIVLLGANECDLLFVDQAICTCIRFKGKKLVLILIQEVFNQRIAASRNQILGDKNLAAYRLVICQQQFDRYTDFGYFVHVAGLPLGKVHDIKKTGYRDRAWFPQQK